MSFSKPALAFTPSWRAKTAQRLAPDIKPVFQNEATNRLSEAVTYIQPSGVSLFPEAEWLKAMFSKLRRG